MSGLGSTFVLLLVFTALGWWLRGQVEAERRRRAHQDRLVPSHGIVLALQRAERRRRFGSGRRVRPGGPHR